MDAKYGNPLQLYKRPRAHYGPRGQTLSRSNAMRSSFAKNRAASTIQRAFGKWRARNAQRGRIASVASLLSGTTRKGIQLNEGGNSLSKCHYGTHKVPIPDTVMRTLQRQVVVTNYAQQSESTVGVQASVEFAKADPATLIAMLGSINGKMILKSIRGETSMVNSSSTNSTVVIYDVIARRDLSTVNVGSCSNAWAKGVDDAGGSATDYVIIGGLPTESVLFNDFFKVIQRTRVSLTPGQMHRHEVTYNPNKILSGELLTAIPYGVAGLTMQTLIVHYGMPAHDSTTHTSVTVDVSALDIVTKTEYDYRELENSITSWSKTNNLATSFAVGEQFVNEAVGQVQDAGGLHPTTLHS